MDSSSTLPAISHPTVRADPAMEVHDWTKFFMRAAVCSVLHPMEYAKTLIQLGYEPIAPKPKTTIFDNSVLALPNIFEYASHIRRTDGFWGCYRGLGPKICGQIFSVVGSSTIADYLELYPYVESQNKGATADEQLYEQFKTNLRRDIVLSSTSLIIQYPFHLISVRMMAQFIGRETLYNSLIGSIIEIYKHEGLVGFFRGFIPKLIYELGLVILTSSSVFLLNKYFIKDRVQRQINGGIAQISFALMLYPLKVVSTCMCITGSRLLAAKEPYSPQYLNWMDCLSDLQARGVSRRGNRLFMRTMPMKRYHNESKESFKTYMR